MKYQKLKTKKLTFDEAIELVQQNIRVRRKIWKDSTHLYLQDRIFKQETGDGGVLYAQPLGAAIMIFIPNTEMTPPAFIKFYIPTIEDQQAQDWELKQ